MDEKTPAGPTISIFIVIILLMIGGIYFFTTQAAKLHQTPSNEEPANS